MKITVEMDEAEFLEFTKFRETKQTDRAELNELYGKYKRLGDMVYHAVDPEARKVIEPETLFEAVKVADSARWGI